MKTWPIPSLSHHARLQLAVVLSLCAHLIFFVAWRSPETLRFSVQPDEILRVSLVDAVRVKTAAPATEKPSERTSPPSVSEQSKNTALRPTEAKPKDKIPNPVPAVARTPEAPPSVDAARAHIRTRLLGELARHFQYPMLARQRGWEGTVLLGLRVESDGQLENLRIERSSGYALLDDSALNSLSRVGRLAEAPGWLNGRGLDMQLPVIYRLIEN